tara:strand:+ start:2312 stop:3442 length:1131 start_codon:yes stop_codon:yes gene_type:complete
MSVYKQANFQLNNFIDNDILSYSKNRNYDYGPSKRNNVSMLSKFISHRIINEYDIVSKSLSRHSLSKIDKYVQEVFWRVYWKGWLEHRPLVWNDYYSYQYNGANQDTYHRALEGTTGIKCFDDWVNELKSMNYLHNHTRMWFASIWIFTLGLPWQLGANFFISHLLDGDSASNTLSWRWVAGLQTLGKHYLATSSNIHKYTNGLYKPDSLNEDAESLSEHIKYDAQDLDLRNSNNRYDILFVFDNDLCFIERKEIYDKYNKIYLIHVPNENRKITLSEPVLNFKKSLLNEFSLNFPNSQILNINELKKDLTQNKKIDVIYPCVGENLILLEQIYARSNINYIYRDEDLFCWKYAKKGFFNFKKNIPIIINKIIKKK